ncbi:MAG: serine/threonine protein kinase [Anaerolineae bacterium]|nr:serine/threonine protein kinase [Anaerolineae bacterium]
MDNLIEKQLGGKYEIQSEIGRGGMGIVYRAFDQNLRRAVALKVLAPQLAVDPDFVQRFRHEAIAAANLRHPNIVIIHDVGADEMEDWPGRSVHFIVMELVDGVTLDQWLVRRRGPMALDDTTRVVQQVSSALQFAHGRGMIHRDIKPSNIMLDDAGRAKLMDFGLVRAGELSHLTRSGTVLGTPQYMAPEQIVGGAVDRRTDIYSLGVVIYELLSGEAPFNRTTPMATAYAHVNEPPPPLRQRQAITPKSVEAVVMKALAKDPTARYQTTTALAEDFNVAAGGVMPAGLSEYDPSKAVAVTAPMQRPGRTAAPPPAPRERSRRTGLILAAVAALLIFLLGGAAIVLNNAGGVDNESATATLAVAVAADTPTATAAADGSAQLAEQPVAAPASGSQAPSAPNSQTATPIEAAATSTSAAPTPTPEAAPPTSAPTSTPIATRPPAKATSQTALLSTPAATPTTAAKVATEPTSTATRPPTPRPVLTPCPSYLHAPLPGMGLLLIENHLGEGLHIDWSAGQRQWDLAPKQGDVPARVVIDLPPGKNDLNDNTDRGGHGHISLVVEAGKAYISPIWYNDRAEELVYPLDIPNGCR